MSHKYTKHDLKRRHDRGTANFSNVTEILEEFGLNPAEAIALCVQEAMKAAGDERYELRDRIAFRKIAASSAAELLKYVAPQLNKTEVSGPGGSVPTFQVVLSGNSTPSKAGIGVSD